ncbi:MAG TPA: hypothetical protein ENI34_05995 [candidate division WOR-3 bacterium]|uniref:DUF6036 domain-containing protein n=1 Tax=candidate division WOR-3 bacterium TaxID=2052148 RepID=A0A9C9EMR8_UNCW3|nr:hypothetical protein [candidate division WOR-3 bacterium]
MFNKLLANIAKSLNTKKIDYMVIGGQAVLLYGEPRFTKDIDITLGLDLSGLNLIIDIVSHLRLTILPDSIEEFVKQTMVLPTLDPKTGLRVDFIFSYSNYEREALKRIKKVKFGRVDVNFASLEDVVIHKIISGRPRDIEDIKIMLLKNPGFDRNYITLWLQKFDRVLKQKYNRVFKKIEKEIED